MLFLKESSGAEIIHGPFTLSLINVTKSHISIVIGGLKPGLFYEFQVRLVV